MGAPSISDGLIEILADTNRRRAWLNQQLSHATQVLDNERIELEIPFMYSSQPAHPTAIRVLRGHWQVEPAQHKSPSLSLFGCPWLPFQYTPTHPDRIPKKGGFI